MGLAEKTMGTTLTKTTGASLIVAGLTSIGRVGGESDELDTTSLDSPNGYREFLMTLKTGGEIPLAGFVKDPDDLEDLLALYEAQSLESWEIETPNGSKWYAQAYVKMCEEGEMTPEGARTFTATLRVSGKPVYAADGTSA